MKTNLFILKFSTAAILFCLTVSTTAAQTKTSRVNEKSKPPAILIEVSQKTVTRSRLASPARLEATAPPKTNALEDEAFREINAQRRRENIEPLELNGELVKLAREHSENMANFNFFSHRGRDGKTVFDRATDVGINDWTMIAENIGYNAGVKNNVELVVQTWLGSASHKNNLLNRQYKRTGIGVALTPAGKFYITQIFTN